MTVPPRCVRVSVFQSPTDDGVATPQQSTTAQGKAGAPAYVTDRLYRSRVDDYRGVALIPLDALPPSSSLEHSNPQRSECTVLQLLEGLEQRLSHYCILHVPPARVEGFARENQLSLSENGSATPQARPQADCSSSHYCACCSSSLLATSPVDAAAPSPRVPWICVRQLQRMDTTVEVACAPTEHVTSSSSPPLPAAITAEEWMLHQHEPSNAALVSSEEAEELHIAAVPDDAVIEGGGCYAAFFQLAMLSATEAAEKQHLRAAVKAAPPSQTPPAQRTAFTVSAQHHTVRIGVPPVPPPAPSENASSEGSSPRLDLKSIVLQRLEQQRGLHVRRLLEVHTGAAVLPCEPAAVLLASSVVSLRAECDGLAHAQQPPTPTQRLPQSTDMTMPTLAPADASAELFDHLAQVRAQRHADQYYYDGFDPQGWADRRTLISLSEPPSESELRMASVPSEASHNTAIMYSHSSSSRQPSLASRATMSAYTASAENSRSYPFAVRLDEVDAEGTNSMPAMAETAHPVVVTDERFAEDVTTRSRPAVAEATPDSNARTVALRRSSLANTSLNTATIVRDSLRDLNQVFVYEDEETVAEPPRAPDDGHRDARGGAAQPRRHSSLVWSTPATRGFTGGGVNLAEMGVSATPLSYRVSTPLRGTSTANSPVAALTAVQTAVPASESTASHPRANQRLVFSHSPLSSDSSASGQSRDESEVTVEGAVGKSVSTAQAESQEASASSTEVEEASEADETASGSDGSSEGNTDRQSNSRSTASFEALEGEHTDEYDSTPPSSRAPGRYPAELSATTLASASPTPSPAVETTTPQHTVAAAHTPPSEEDTRSMCLPSTPPSRSRTSDRELRSHIQSLNPQVTQSSQGSSPPRSDAHQPGRDEAAKVHISRNATDTTPTASTPIRGSALMQARVPYESAAGSVERLSVRRAAQAQVDWSEGRRGLRLTPAEQHALLSPRTPVVSTRIVRIRGSGPEGDRVAPPSVSSSLPTTVVASKAVKRRRSPIYFSSDELTRMAARAMSEATTTTPNSESSRGASAWEGDNVHDSHDWFGVVQRASSQLGYDSGVVASYLAPEMSDLHFAREDYVAGWSYSPETPSTPLSRDGQAAEHLLDTQRSGASQRAQAPPPSFVNVGGSSQSVPLVSVSARWPGPAAAASDRGKHPFVSQPRADSSVLDSAPRVVSRHLRRSPSHSASGMETWIRCSDEEESRRGPFMEDGSVAEEDQLMLVTQQEAPIYTGHDGSSGSSEEEEGEDEEEAEEEMEAEAEEGVGHFMSDDEAEESENEENTS